MKIVGVGAGQGLMTQEAIKAVREARVVYGSRRAIELAREHIRCEWHELSDYTLKNLPQDAVVLSTGDPMLSGLGRFASRNDTIIPGISSLQLACARLRIELGAVAVVNAHARDIRDAKDAMQRELGAGKIVFMLPDASFGAIEAAGFLRSRGLRYKIAVLENLSYEDERVEIGDVEKPPAARHGMYSMLIGNFEP